MPRGNYIHIHQLQDISIIAPSTLNANPLPRGAICLSCNGRGFNIFVCAHCNPAAAAAAARATANPTAASAETPGSSTPSSPGSLSRSSSGSHPSHIDPNVARSYAKYGDGRDSTSCGRIDSNMNQPRNPWSVICGLWYVTLVCVRGILISDTARAGVEYISWQVRQFRGCDFPPLGLSGGWLLVVKEFNCGLYVGRSFGFWFMRYMWYAICDMGYLIWDMVATWLWLHLRGFSLTFGSYLVDLLVFSILFVLSWWMHWMLPYHAHRLSLDERGRDYAVYEGQLFSFGLREAFSFLKFWYLHISLRIYVVHVCFY